MQYIQFENQLESVKIIKQAGKFAFSHVRSHHSQIDVGVWFFSAFGSGTEDQNALYPRIADENLRNVEVVALRQPEYQ